MRWNPGAASAAADATHAHDVLRLHSHLALLEAARLRASLGDVAPDFLLAPLQVPYLAQRCQGMCPSDETLEEATAACESGLFERPLQLDSPERVPSASMAACTDSQLPCSRAAHAVLDELQVLELRSAHAL